LAESTSYMVRNVNEMSLETREKSSILLNCTSRIN